MAEIVVADPIYEDEGHTNTNTVKTYTTTPVTMSLTTISYGYHDHYVPEPFESERLPPTLEYEIQRFLRVANLIGKEEPRVAYLCKLFVFFGNWGCFIFIFYVIWIIGFDWKWRYRMFLANAGYVGLHFTKI